MASSILGASAAAAAAGTAATISPKGALSRLGLRTPSARDVITGKRIPGSASNHFLQRLGMETEEDRQKIINEAERKSSRKKGLGFVFKLLLKTLEDMKTIEILGDDVDPSEWEGLLGQLKILKKKEDKLLYIIAYTSVLTDEKEEGRRRNDMGDLLYSIKTVFHLRRHPRMVTNWQKLYGPNTYDYIYNSQYGITSVFGDLDDKISAVKEYIKDIENKEKTRDRRGARMVARFAASKHNLDPTLAPYEIEGHDTPGPFSKIGKFIPDTPEHKWKTIATRGDLAGQKFLKEYHRQRRQRAIQRDIALGRITEEEARKLPEDYGRALNTGGRRSRKRKTRKRRKRKRTRKKRKSKRKKTKKRKQKGRGANICQMLSDPNRFGFTKKEVRAMALRRAVKAGRNIPRGRCVGKRVAQVEAHHYCQEMNNWDDNYKCHEKNGNCVKIVVPSIKQAINDRLRSQGYKL